MILTLFFRCQERCCIFVAFFQATLSIGGGSNTNYAHQYRQTAMTAMQAVMAVYKILECSA